MAPSLRASSSKMQATTWPWGSSSERRTDMDSQKLIEDIKALLLSAGFGEVTSSPEGEGAIVSGRAGSGGAFFRWTPQVASKASAHPTSGGGPAAASKADVSVVPSVPGTEELMASEPAMVSRLREPSPDVVAALTARPTQ